MSVDQKNRRPLISKLIRSYLIWAGVGAISGPILWMSYFALVIYYYGGPWAFLNVEYLRYIVHEATRPESVFFLRLTMPAGALLFLAVYAFVAFVRMAIQVMSSKERLLR